MKTFVLFRDGLEAIVVRASDEEHAREELVKVLSPEHGGDAAACSLWLNTAIKLGDWVLSPAQDQDQGKCVEKV